MKEKAEELVLKFLRIENNTPEWFNVHIAKQCALIAVEEMLTEMSEYFDRYDCTDTLAKIEYWQQVKTEINNL